MNLRALDIKRAVEEELRQKNFLRNGERLTRTTQLAIYKIFEAYRRADGVLSNFKLEDAIAAREQGDDEYGKATDALMIDVDGGSRHANAQYIALQTAFCLCQRFAKRLDEALREKEAKEIEARCPETTLSEQ